jgi:hypothetical protein
MAACSIPIRLRKLQNAFSHIYRGSQIEFQPNNAAVRQIKADADYVSIGISSSTPGAQLEIWMQWHLCGLLCLIRFAVSRSAENIRSQVVASDRTVKNLFDRATMLGWWR